MNGKIVLIFILSQLCANGWWYCVTQQTVWNSTPMCVIPFLSSVGLVGFLMVGILDRWEG